MSRVPLVAAFLLIVVSCTSPSAKDMCSSMFTPYPDLVSGRVRTTRNALFVDGMVHYGRHEYAEAVERLSQYVTGHHPDRSAYLYLACSYLALGKPFDAELQLDHLEGSNLRQFEDEAEWYTVICWVCSDQLDRARAGAERISRMKHTYSREAVQLLKALGAGPAK